jgi:RNA-directed DNA polymerase
MKGICIELYYKDYEIQREDTENRRLFLSNEFRPKTGRHKDSDFIATDKNKIIKKDELKILDDNVFDRDEKNVALSKNRFADYILAGEKGFNDFDFEEFYEVFKTIEKIVKFHIGNDGISS